MTRAADLARDRQQSELADRLGEATTHWLRHKCFSHLAQATRDLIDTGKAISMLCGGITESGVAIALILAKERFGSTLTINGTADFKRLVVDAVAKNGLDVHFSDKARNVSLAARRTELEIGKGGQSIVPANDRPQHVDNTNRASRDLADRLDLTKPIEELNGLGQAAEQISRVIAPKLETHVPEPERAAFVGDVAKSLGIPDRDQPAGDLAFTQWQAQRSTYAQASAQRTPGPAVTATPHPAQDDTQSPSKLVRP